MFSDCGPREADATRVPGTTHRSWAWLGLSSPSGPQVLSGHGPMAHHGARRQASPGARPVVAGKSASFVVLALAAKRVMASRTVENSRWA